MALSTPDILIFTTAWLAGLGYAGGVGLRLGDGTWSKPASRVWLVGALMMLVHVLLSFHFRHHWSHDAAVFETARQTKELIGWDWGGGVWLNYLLVVVWLGDALWLNLAKGHYLSRGKWITWFVQGFLAFMWFNATVVFGSWGARVFGDAMMVALCWLGRTSSRR